MWNGGLREEAFSEHHTEDRAFRVWACSCLFSGGVTFNSERNAVVQMELKMGRALSLSRLAPTGHLCGPVDVAG